MASTLTSIYLSLVGTSALSYASYLHLTGFKPTLPRVLTIASFHGILWPATSIILTTFGIWFRFLPQSGDAFPIAGLICLIPSFAFASSAANDFTSPPAARKADRKPTPPPVVAASSPPPPPVVQQQARRRSEPPRWGSSQW